MSDATLPPAFFARPVDAVAHDLIGAVLTVDGTGGRIVETEAYDVGDAASHSFRGRTARNAAMFGPVGHAYVYRIYGLHWCLNLVAGTRPGGAVLIRALEPMLGRELMRRRRGGSDDRGLCSGPGRLCQALDVDRRLDGLALNAAPFALAAAPGRARVLTGPRIGITRAVDLARRFGEAESPWLSRPFQAAPTSFPGPL